MGQCLALKEMEFCLVLEMLLWFPIRCLGRIMSRIFILVYYFFKGVFVLTVFFLQGVWVRLSPFELGVFFFNYWHCFFRIPTRYLGVAVCRLLREGVLRAANMFLDHYKVLG